MLGQHKRNLTIVPYQSTWKEYFEQEANRLRRTLGEKALQIEHHGSTSIPGMMAKPIIDILVAVESLDDASSLIPLLESTGYIYRSHDIIPERLFFAKERAPQIRTHHLSLTEFESSFWKNQLAFRDYLRTHEQIAVEYIELKKQLAEYYVRTNHLDREWKTDFVNKVLALANIEAALKPDKDH
jgi:GrpB-like predicted nucleotidyltransferase (UPF0157 family)